MHSEDGIVLVKNFSYLSLLEVANYLFPLVTLPYLSRVLGPEYFGILAIGSAVIAYFQSIIDYGFNFSSVKEIASNKDDHTQVNRVFIETLFSRLFLLLIAYSILFSLVVTIPYFSANREVIIITSSLLIGYALMTDWFFQAIEEMQYIAIVSLVSNIITTSLIFLLIKTSSDYLLQPILISCGFIASSALGGFIIIKRYHIHFYFPPFRSIIKRIKAGFNLFVSIFLPSIYTNLNTILLGAYNGSKATGIYSGGAKFTSIAYRITMLLSRVFFPFLSRKLNRHQVFVLISVSLGALISVFFYVFSGLIVKIFLGPEFVESVTVLRIVSFTPLAMSIFNVYGTNYLVIKGGERYLRNIVVFTTIVGLILGVLGARYYSYIGVAVCSLVTQSFRALASFLCAKSMMKKES